MFHSMSLAKPWHTATICVVFRPQQTLRYPASQKSRKVRDVCKTSLFVHNLRSNRLLIGRICVFCVKIHGAPPHPKSFLFPPGNLHHRRDVRLRCDANVGGVNDHVESVGNAGHAQRRAVRGLGDPSRHPTGHLLRLSCPIGNNPAESPHATPDSFSVPSSRLSVTPSDRAEFERRGPEIVVSQCALHAHRRNARSPDHTFHRSGFLRRDLACMAIDVRKRG